MFLGQALEAYQLANDAAQHFELRATGLGAVKVEDNLALQMLNYGRCLSSQIDAKFFKNQIELSDADQEMCQVIICISYEQQFAIQYLKCSMDRLNPYFCHQRQWICDIQDH